jgi:hypothetical protein
VDEDDEVIEMRICELSLAVILSNPRKTSAIFVALFLVASDGATTQADSNKRENLAKFEEPYIGLSGAHLLRESVTFHCFSDTSGTVGYWHDALDKKDTKLVSELDRKKPERLTPQWKISIEKDRASVVDDRLNTFSLRVFRRVGRVGGLMLMQWEPDSVALSWRLVRDPFIVITIDIADSSFVYTEHVMGPFGNFTTVWLGRCR